MTRLLLIATVATALLACRFAAAHDGDHPPLPVKPAEAYAPKMLPDRIILTWADEPTTTQAVTWRTSTAVTKGLAEIAVASAGPEFPKAARQVTAATEPLKTDLSEA